MNINIFRTSTPNALFCRIFGRKQFDVLRCFCDPLVENAEGWQARKVFQTFVKTPRNQILRRLWTWQVLIYKWWRKLQKKDGLSFTKSAITFFPKKSWKIWRHIWKAECQAHLFCFLVFCGVSRRKKIYGFL